jgi:formylglycine-generating enzyme required for sulfatase activity
MVDIPAGDFIMGFSRTPLPPSLGAAARAFPNGDADEQPYHPVSISAFRIAATETTNAQFEQFDPSHKLLRGKYYFSHDDGDAVLGQGQGQGQGQGLGQGQGRVDQYSLLDYLTAEIRFCGYPTTKQRSIAAG